MTDLQPLAPAPIAFVMLPGAGPACEGDDCLPAAAAAPQQADPTSAGS